jgi:hypothetical protein
MWGLENCVREMILDGANWKSKDDVYCRNRVIIKNYDKIAPLAKQMADSFVDLIQELAGEGCPVEVRVEGQ